MEEIVAEGWDLTGIQIEETEIDNSTPSGNIANIVLDADETVIVTFNNTKQGVDLRITKTDTVDPVDRYTTFSYDIHVENLGSDTATGVIVTDTLPSEVNYQSSTPTYTSASGSVYTWEIGDLSPGGSYDISITVAADAVAEALNTVEVNSNEDDINPATNVATEQTVILEPL